jgi:hypothetical protein
LNAKPSTGFKDIPLQIENTLSLLDPYITTSRLLVTQEDVIKEEERQTRNKELENKYQCMGSPNVNAISKNDCETTGGVWDKPVKDDTECPFFLANKNYPNQRGGVHNGYCELPSGIQNIGYRFFDVKSRAQCYQCDMTKLKPDDIVDPKTRLGYCCDKQEKPFYKFAGDNYEVKPFIQVS